MSEYGSMALGCGCVIEATGENVRRLACAKHTRDVRQPETVSDTIAVRLPAGAKEKLKAAARASDMTLSEWVRTVCSAAASTTCGACVKGIAGPHGGPGCKANGARDD